MLQLLNVVLLRLVLCNHCTLVFLHGILKSIWLQSSAFMFMLRALRGYQALRVIMLLVVNYLLVKACLYSNDRFVDSILSIIDLMRVNFECVK